jgi:hypothetical protein
MNVSNWISIGSAVIVAIGWFVTAYYNRRKDIAAKRLEYRLTALKSFLPVWFAIQKDPSPFTSPVFLSMFEDARSNIQLYGRSDEVKSMEMLVSAVEKNDLQKANATLSSLVPLIRERIRKELEIT